MERYVSKLLWLTMTVLILGLTVFKAQAEEYRQHEAHEHGVAHMNVAVEDKNLYIEFVSPAANIVGFEHHPRTQAQKDAVQAAVKKLKSGALLFKLPPEARGQLVGSTVDTDIDHDARYASEAEHAHDHDNDKPHGNADMHGKDHHDGDEHEGERHSEFNAEYRFVCQTPEELAHIEVMLFQLFPGIEHIEVQILTDAGQTAQELTAQKSKIHL